MSNRNRSGYIATHGAGSHDFVTSGGGDYGGEYSSFFAWGGDASVTYEQLRPSGSWVSGSATITQSDPGIYSTMRNIAVTGGGTVIAYRKL